MKLLREYIRELLTEGAMGLEDMADDVFVRVREDGDRVTITYSNEDGSMYKGSGLSYGRIEIYHPTGRAQWSVDPEPCATAWMVGGTNAEPGWGPLLYDVAVEFATLNGGGLIADRSSVSKDAFNVWQYYMNSRPDVEHVQLDDTSNTLTPEESDNCEIESALRHAPYTSAEIFSDEWTDQDSVDFLVGSPLMKAYRKSPTTMNNLRTAGRLIEE